MKRTTARGTLAACLVLVFAAMQVAAKDEPAGASGHSHHAMAFAKCAAACSDCQRECDSCSSHCAMKITEGDKAHAVTLQTCLDCGDLCAAASQIVSRGGPFSDLICQSCADACGRCAKECNKFPDDAHMKKCADECLKCEKACREMLKHTGKS